MKEPEKGSKTTFTIGKERRCRAKRIRRKREKRWKKGGREAKKKYHHNGKVKNTRGRAK